MRVAFLGSDAIALPALEFLRGTAGVEFAGVISQPDRPAGRGRRLQANPVAAWARAQGVPLLQPDRPGDAEIAWLRAERVELALVMAYGRLLPAALLEAPARGVWNLHASLLPAYRGASPVEAALVSGEAETGLCLMQVVPALDAGPVADAIKVVIPPGDTGLALRERLAQAAGPLLARNLEALARGTVRVEPQDEAGASYTRKLTKADAGLDFGAPAVELERRVRALQPWPGTVVEHAGVTLKIALAVALPAETSGAAPGTVLRADADGLEIATGAGALRLLELQRPGGRMLPAAEFLRGWPVTPGERLEGRAMRPLVSPRPFPAAKKRPVSG
jgi:methionyl-tRNA formyltransferase